MESAATRDTVAGAVGAICCVYAGLPFDLVKCLRQTIRHEGVRSLWKGAAPALASAGIENAVLFAANGALKRVYSQQFVRETNELSVWTQACLGGVAGIFSAAAINFPELIKCRLQAQHTSGHCNSKSSPFRYAVNSIASEGPRICVRGLPALWLRDIPFNFIFFGAYEAYSRGFRYISNIKDETLLSPMFVLLAGGFAGATGWGVVFPLDVLKSRMQTASNKNERLLTMRSVASQVYKTQGIKGFYKGWSAAVLRAFPANGALFLGVECTHRFFNNFSR